MFCTFRGLERVDSDRLCFSTNAGEMKHSMAPLSSSAFLLACQFLVYSKIGTLIDLFQAIYTESIL